MKRIMFVAVVAALAFPGSAWADSGSIAVTSNSYTGTPGFANIGVSVTVTKTTCDFDSSYCGWFPYVTEAEPNQACTTSGGRYTGQIVDGMGTFTQDLGTALFQGTSKKLCLYIYSNGDWFLAETVVQLNSRTSPAPTTPPPTTQPVATAPMGVSEARGYLSSVLRKRYGKRFTRRRGGLHRSCYRLTHEKVRCRVSWKTKIYKYTGTVTLRNDPADPAGSFLYATRIHRKKRVRSRRVSSPSRPAPSCDSNYSGCLDPNASDYDCAGGSGDGPRYTGEVRVYGNDHYDLDRDGDGVACDDPSAASAQTRRGVRAARADRAREIQALRSAVRLSRRR